MKLINILAACVLAGVAFGQQPVLTWTDFDEVQISGADYAYIEGADELDVELSKGIYILGSVAWADSDGILSYLIDPSITYTVQAFVVDPVNPDTRTQTTIAVSAAPREQLDYIVYQRILWEEKMNAIIADQGFGYFEISDSIQRMRNRLIAEGILPNP